MGSIHKLIIEDDEGKTTVVPVSRGEITIGRMEGNTIRLMERNVSRRHARLIRENGSIHIEDLNSFNGVKINGERIDKRIEIKEGDLVEIGDYHLALQAAQVEDDAGGYRGDHTPVMSGGGVPAGPGALAAGAKTVSDTPWIGGPGAPTLPDFSPPEDILAGVREHQIKVGVPPALPHRDAQAAANQAILDTRSMPPPGAEPLVGPPDRNRPSQPVLPPFPGAGGISMPTIPGVGVVPVPKNDAGLAKTEQIQVGAARVSDVPRLVCVSTEYAGRDFALTRPELVIGRVEDNDIVIEHRSVSRNHAKIVFDGRVHKIIDLESANGILVNGEEYAITDLRKSDLIELGHVKFRFVPAGEPFLPTDEETRAMIDAGVSPAGPPGRAPEPSLPPPIPSPAAKPISPLSAPPPMHKLDGAQQRHAAMSVETADEPLGPPSSLEISGVSSADDPSNAATVTDTPLSAFGVPELFQPRVEGSAVRTESDRRHDGRNGAGAPALATARHEPPTVETPTTGATGSMQAMRGSSPRAPADAQRRPTPTRPAQLRQASDLDDALRGNKGKVIAASLLLLAVLAMLIGGGFFIRNNNSNANTDREIQRLFDSGQWDAVETYYKQNRTRFRDGEKAYDLAAAAHEKSQKKPDELNALPPSGDKVAAAVVPTEGHPVAAAPAPAPEDELPLGDEEETAKARPAAPLPPGTKRPPVVPVARPKAPTIERARAYENLGRKALLEGDLTKAEHLLKLCLQQSEYALCHRGLGVLFASRNDSKQSLQHYERYLQLDPNASDADRVRKIISDAKNGL